MLGPYAANKARTFFEKYNKASIIMNGEVGGAVDSLEHIGWDFTYTNEKGKDVPWKLSIREVKEILAKV